MTSPSEVVEEEVLVEPFVLLAATGGGASILRSCRRAIEIAFLMPRSYWSCWRLMYACATSLASNAPALRLCPSTVIVMNSPFSEVAFAFTFPLAATFAMWLCCAFSRWRTVSTTIELMMSACAPAARVVLLALTPFSPSCSSLPAPRYSWVVN